MLLLSAHRRGLGWLVQFGGAGLIPLGLADNSVIPLPGSMDVFTVWLAANNREIWFYYALMATIGAVLGGYLTYRIAYKGGKIALERKFSRRNVDKIYAKFERWGFGAVAVPALLPPPFPIVPALLAAGALQYPRKRFLAALALGRAIRYTILAFLGARYGRHIKRFFSQYYKQTLAALIAFVVLGGVLALWEYFNSNKSEGQQRRGKPRAA